MNPFTHEEENLVCIYDQGSRTKLITDLTEMTGYLTAGEKALHDLTRSVIVKLQGMTDEEYLTLLPSLEPDFGSDGFSCGK